MKNLTKDLVIPALLLLSQSSVWADSNGDSYIPDEKSMISKGVPDCYVALSNWISEHSKGDATAPTPPEWVTAKCAVKTEKKSTTVYSEKNNPYWSSN